MSNGVVPKVYLAGAIRGDREFIEYYRSLISFLEGREDCHVLAELSLIGRSEKLKDDAAIYTRDRAWLDQADLMIAEISAPSLGVGYEIAYALHVRRIPVLALRHARIGRSSAMVEGNQSPGLTLWTYEDAVQMQQRALEFIRKSGYLI